MCHCSKDAAKNHPFKPHGTDVFQAVFPQRHAQLPVAPPFFVSFRVLCGHSSSCLPKRSRGASASRGLAWDGRLMCHCSKDAAKNHPFKPHGAGVFQAVFPQRHTQLSVAPPFLCLFAFFVAIPLHVFQCGRDAHLNPRFQQRYLAADVPLLERRRQESSIQTARQRRLSSSVSPAPRSIACRPTLCCAFSRSRTCI
jgi:hypothetical protein